LPLVTVGLDRAVALEYHEAASLGAIYLVTSFWLGAVQIRENDCGRVYRRGAPASG
jgi:hypothetical protein